MRAVALASALLLAAAFPGFADTEVEAGSNEFHASAQTSTAPSTSAPGAPIASSDNQVRLVYEPVCSRGSGAGPEVYYGCGGTESCGQDGELHLVTAVSPTDSVPQGTICFEAGVTPPPEVLTPGRILEAFRRVPLPTTPLEVQPPGGRTLVNFDTILHTDAEPFRESVQLLNRTVEFDIEPSEFTWSLGDGTSFTTTDPGRTWREGLSMSEYVSHRYEEAGDVDLQLTTTWSARWRVGGGPWRPVQGTVDTTSPPVSLDVVTARPQLVSYD